MKQFPRIPDLLAVLCLAATLVAPSAPARAAETGSEFTKGVIDIGIVVADPGKTAAFLTNAIGFTEVRGFSVTPELGKKIGLIDGHPVDVRMFLLTEGDLATRIKILSFPKAKTAKPDQTTIHSTYGMRYLTLYVRDMGQALQRLDKAGVKPIGETPLDLGGGTYITVVRDPDGNFVELIGPKKG